MGNLGCSSESAPLFGKDPADLIVHRQDFNIIKETLQALCCFLLVPSVRHSLIELSQRYDAQPNAMRRQLFESPHHRLAGLHIVVDDQDLYTIVITTYIPPRQVGDGPWTPWYADYYHPEV